MSQEQSENFQQWEKLSDVCNESPKDEAQMKADMFNLSVGDLDKSIYDCPICKNKGFVYGIAERFGEYYEVARKCECQKIRNSINAIKRSGLEPILNRSTFEKYEVTEEWQQKVKNKAETFANEVDRLPNKCFYVGGGVGAGKTHLCTAIVKSQMDKGKEAKYMLWVRDSSKLKSMVNDPEYEYELDEYRKVDVIYIDDFFKITKDGYGKETLPTSADIRLAYEIINYRYQHSELITIISSERFINEIDEIDSAVGSRIYEMCGTNVIGIARDKKRNYRLRGMDVL